VCILGIFKYTFFQPLLYILYLLKRLISKRCVANLESFLGYAKNLRKWKRWIVTVYLQVNL